MLKCYQRFSTRRGNIIIRDSKLKKRRSKNGYTLVELVVVLAIIAFVSTFAISTYVYVRAQTEVDTATSDLVSAIRSAETKSKTGIADCNNVVPKAWAVKIHGYSGLAEVYAVEGPTNFQCSNMGIIKNSVNISIQSPSGFSLTSPTSATLAYVNPFGTPFVQNDPRDCAGAIPVCSWVATTKVTGELMLQDQGSPIFVSPKSNSNNTIITISSPSFPGASRTIQISSTGVLSEL